MSQVQPLAANFAKLSFFANAEMNLFTVSCISWFSDTTASGQNLLLSCIYYQKTQKENKLF